MSQTPAFIARLTNIRLFGPGERARLRTLVGRGLDADTDGFDVFTGLWWPLRQNNQFAPRREVAWLVAKLFSACPVPHQRVNGRNSTLARILARREPREPRAKERFRRRFDTLICSTLGEIEPHLDWALKVVSKAIVLRQEIGLDWVQLTDDLSVWDRGDKDRRKEDIREIWAQNYLTIFQNEEGEPHDVD